MPFQKNPTKIWLNKCRKHSSCHFSCMFMSFWRVPWLLSSTWVNWKRPSPMWTKQRCVDETASRQTQLMLLLFMTISVWSVQEWQCSGGMGMTGPNPRKLSQSLPVTLPCSLVLDLCFSRFHLFAVLISGKLHIGQSNLHCHNQWNIWITADCWLLFICEGRKDRKRSCLSVNVLPIFSSAGGTQRFLYHWGCN